MEWVSDVAYASCTERQNRVLLFARPQSLSQLFCLISMGQSSLLTFSFFMSYCFFPPCFSSGSSALVFLLPALLSSAKDEVKQSSSFLCFALWFGCFALNQNSDYLREVRRYFCCVHSEPGSEKAES